ncbi:hypothetical protein B0H14DRAFT_2602033 [Mycena olivaceomarginata]|nr:hypothetical protein B0H14DRAFT_2602033 [Mycena olivaceomarginata]
MSGLWAQARQRDEQPQYHPSLALEPEKRKKIDETDQRRQFPFTAAPPSGNHARHCEKTCDEMWRREVGSNFHSRPQGSKSRYSDCGIPARENVPANANWGSTLERHTTGIDRLGTGRAR